MENSYIAGLGKAAKEASFALQSLSSDAKNSALLAVADAIVENGEYILERNAIDVDRAQAAGTSAAMIDRLSLSVDRIEAMALGIKQIIELSDPIGETICEFDRPNGLRIRKVKVPMGVIGIIYESRPNVTLDAFGLCFKTGNAVILRGGSDAIESNKAIVATIRNTLDNKGITPNAVNLVEDTSRETASALMRLNQYVDLLIPRGGAGLIKSVVENATIPVIETGTGNCHIYVDETVDLDNAMDIIDNAKTQRMGVCNACENILVHSVIAAKAIPMICERLGAKNIEIRAGERAYINCIADTGDIVKATEEDYATEFLGPIVALEVVDSVEEAVSHINKYTTHHSEAILTQNNKNAEYFLSSVDAACVYVNASTRFTDGFEFGFGAEIGISTQKLHARGPMGLNELTSYKYKIYGTGQVRP